MRQSKRVSSCAGAPASGAGLSSVRSRLLGGSLLIIGGDVRATSLDRLKRDLGLSLLEWIPTRDSDPTPRSFEAIVRRQEFSLVVLLQGLVRHQHARDVAAICSAAQVELVRLWRSLSVSALCHALSLWSHNDRSF